MSSDADLRETLRCPCFAVAGILDGRAELPAHLCEASARASVEAWSRSVQICAPYFSSPGGARGEQADPRREWLVPLDDFVYVRLGTGDPDDPIPYPPQVAKVAEDFGRLYAVLRRWAEEPERKLGARFREEHPEAWDTCVRDAFLVAKSAFDNSEAVPLVSLKPHPTRVSRGGTVEQVRRLVLPNSPFPATPGTARYFLAQAAPDHPEVRDKSRPPIPTRGALVTSFLIRPHRPGGEGWLEREAILIHRTDAKHPWLSDAVFRQVAKTTSSNAEWWEEQSGEFTAHTLRGGSLADAELHGLLARVEAGDLTEDAAKEQWRRVVAGRVAAEGGQSPDWKAVMQSFYNAKSARKRGARTS